MEYMLDKYLNARNQKRWTNQELKTYLKIFEKKV